MKQNKWVQLFGKVLIWLNHLHFKILHKSAVNVFKIKLKKLKRMNSL